MLINFLCRQNCFRINKNLFFRMKFVFSQMPYFRQIAEKLNVTVPKLNLQISMGNSEKCTVYGIKQIPFQGILKEEAQNRTQQSIDRLKRKDKYYDEQTLVGFSIDKNSKQTLQFSLVQRIAQNLELDICLMKQPNSIQTIDQSQQNNNLPSQNEESQNNAVLLLSRFRENVYREYYLKELKNKSKRKYIEAQLTNQNLLSKQDWSPNTKGSYKNKTKMIRIGEDTHANDMKNKKNQIIAWIEQGERTVKVISHNISDKSYKAIEKFCSMFQKEVRIIEEKVLLDKTSKKQTVRYYAMLQFDQQIQVDFNFINQRWRRRQAEIKLALQGKKNKKSIFDVDLTKQDSIVQKAFLSAFDQSGIPYPKQYQFLTDIDKGFQKQGVISLVRDTVQQLDKKKQQQNINEFQDQPLTDKQRKERDKENRKIMGLRTVEDILEEMEEIKSRQYEMEQYESARYKELEKELTDLLKNAKKYAAERVDREQG